MVEAPLSPQFGPSPERRAGTQQSQQNNSTQQENSRTPGAVKYSCKTCGRKFSKKPYANAHCKPKAVWKCDNCGVEIKQSSNVKRHERSCAKPIQVKDVQVLSCTECGRKFSKRCNLERHKAVVHDISEEKVIKCPDKDCGYSTNRAKNMKKHNTLTHAATSSTFLCGKCDYSCFSAAGLRYHRTTIHGIACEVCHKLFSTEQRLLIHMSTVHKRSNQSNVKLTQVVIARKIGEHATVVGPETSDTNKDIVLDENIDVE